MLKTPSVRIEVRQEHIDGAETHILYLYVNGDCKKIYFLEIEWGDFIKGEVYGVLKTSKFLGIPQTLVKKNGEVESDYYKYFKHIEKIVEEARGA